jgi:hypothetical protein
MLNCSKAISSIPSDIAVQLPFKLEPIDAKIVQCDDPKPLDTPAIVSM